MKIDKQFAKYQLLYNFGYRFNPIEKIMFLNENKQGETIPHEFKEWTIQLFNPSDYLNKRLAPIIALTKQMQATDPTISDGLRLTIKDIFAREHDVPLYDYNNDGDIRMIQYDLDRQVFPHCTYTSPEQIESAIQLNKQTHNEIFTVKTAIRLNPLYQESLLPDSKYNFTYSCSTPFFDPAIIHLFDNEQEVETLIVTEGQFKAFTANRIGLPTIGLTSITHWRNPLSNGLHTDILRLIERTKPYKFVLLWDGDCLKQSRSLDKPLGTRPYLFYKMAHTILLHIKANFPNMKTYFARVRTEKMKRKPKGIDDLILSYPSPEHIQNIKKDLTTCNRESPYFEIVNTDRDTKSTLDRFFEMDRYNHNEIRHYMKSNILNPQNV